MTGQRRNSNRLSGESKGKGSLARAVLEVSCGWTVDGCKGDAVHFFHTERAALGPQLTQTL